jgi:hypothetical protein
LANSLPSLSTIAVADQTIFISVRLRIHGPLICIFSSSVAYSSILAGARHHRDARRSCFVDLLVVAMTLTYSE